MGIEMRELEFDLTFGIMVWRYYLPALPTKPDGIAAAPKTSPLCQFLAAARAGAGQNARLVRRGGLLLLGLSDARRSTEQLASACDVGGAIAIGEQAVVTDAVEALGQHVHEHAADELGAAAQKGGRESEEVLRLSGGARSRGQVASTRVCDDD
jgi:hypothetical protein